MTVSTSLRRISNNMFWKDLPRFYRSHAAKNSRLIPLVIYQYLFNTVGDTKINEIFARLEKRVRGEQCKRTELKFSYFLVICPWICECSDINISCQREGRAYQRVI